MGNSYPYGQCTWYANERYQQATGTYVPWMGDAHSWASLARVYGWQVSDTPFAGPCILCLQPLVQLAGPLGHVAYVESVVNGSTVDTSNMNWGVTQAEQSEVRRIRFTTGPGVQFIAQHGTTISTSSTSSGTQSAQWSPINLFAAQTGQLQPLFDWFSDPTRLLKLVAGIALVVIALLSLFEPQIEQAGETLAKVAVLA